MSRLFHLIPVADGEALLEHGTHRPASLASEGFVHLSFADQAAESWRLHFDPAQALWLLELDPASVAADLRLEPSRGGAEFPHLYRELRRDDVLRRWELGAGQPFPDLDA